MVLHQNFVLLKPISISRANVGSRTSNTNPECNQPTNMPAEQPRLESQGQQRMRWLAFFSFSRLFHDSKMAFFGFQRHHRSDLEWRTRSSPSISDGLGLELNPRAFSRRALVELENTLGVHCHATILWSFPLCSVRSVQPGHGDFSEASANGRLDMIHLFPSEMGCPQRFFMGRRGEKSGFSSSVRTKRNSNSNKMGMQWKIRDVARGLCVRRLHMTHPQST
jgi:hypothetical protein